MGAAQKFERSVEVTGFGGPENQSWGLNFQR